MRGIAVIAGLLCVGCVRGPELAKVPGAPDLASLYGQASVEAVAGKAEPDDTVTARFSGATIREVAGWLASYGYGMVCAEGLEKRSITAEFVDTRLSEAMYWIGRRLQCDVVRVGRTYYLGQVEAEDRAYYCARWRGNPESAGELLRAVISDSGKVVVADGIAVVVDSRRVIDRVRGVVEAIDAGGQPVWVVQLAFLRFRESSGHDLGVDVSASGQLAVSLAEASTGFARDVTLTGIVHATRHAEGQTVEALPCFVVLEGAEASWSDGEAIPVARRSVSDQGTVTTTGYDVVQAGTEFKATINGAGSKLGRLNLSLRVGSVSGYVGEYPVVVQGEYSGESVVESGRTYLLAQFGLSRRRGGRSNWLQREREVSRDLVQVWGRCWRLGEQDNGLSWPVRVEQPAKQTGKGAGNE